MKAMNNYKRFTFTPLISASGVMKKIHVLFANLKRVPKNLNQGAIVEVNKSGMWSKAILEEFIRKVILTRHNTKFKKRKTLPILNSFSGHLGLEDIFKNQNLFIRYIPPGMIGILQVLDVFCNRSFQQFYGDKYDTWLSQNINNNECFTPNGNLRTVPYTTVVDWCVEFKDQFCSSSIVKGFEKCGVAFNQFSKDQCHSALREILTSGEITEDDQSNTIFYPDTTLLNLQDWNLEKEYDFFDAVAKITGRTKEVIKNEICVFLKNNLTHEGIIDDDYVNSIINESQPPYLNEIYAFSKVFSKTVVFYEYEKHPFEFKNGNETIDILLINGKYFLK